MNDKQDKPVLDKSEQQRLEREARIKRLKDKDGSKKKLKTQSRLGRVLLPVILVLLVVGGLAWAAFNLGLVHRLVKPMKVGDENIGLVEYNYHYTSYYNTYSQYTQYGMAPTDALGKLDLDADTEISGYEGKNWGEYLDIITQQSIQQVVAFADKAKQEGIEITDEDKSSIDDFFGSVEAQYPTELEQTNYYESVYGRGASEETLRPVLERTLLANEYVTEHPQTYDVTAEEVAAYYEENKDTYDVVEYRLYTMAVPAAEEDATDEEKEELKKETEEKANEMLGKVTDFDSFKKVVLEYVESEDKPEYKNEDPTYQGHKKASQITNPTVSEWLFDEARKPGDKEVLNSGSNYYVVYFNERTRPEEKMPSVRHILFAAKRESATDEELKAAEDKAKETLEKITDEESVIALSEELTANEESAEARLYENVERGTMVEEFEDWIYDPARKAGDKDIVQTSYGYHVMYFTGWSEEPAWYMAADKALRDEEFAAESEELVKEEAYTVTVNDLGIRLAGN